MKQKLAFIIVDIEFSQSALEGAAVLGFFDVASATSIAGEPFVSAEKLRELSGGPGNHGSVILSRLRLSRPDAAFVLIRASDAEGKFIRTGWKDGQIDALGWTEYWLEAVKLCQDKGYLSVTNLSFGGYVHAMDGGGWESFQLSQFTGPGKPGHVVLAAAGDGDGKAEHASLSLAAGQDKTIEVWQPHHAAFNFWSWDTRGWRLEVWHNGHRIQAYDGATMAANVWNGKQQVNFSIGEPGGMTYLRLFRSDNRDDCAGDARFDCWIRSGHARFHNFIAETLICEPAVFPHVIAVGLADKHYGPMKKPILRLPAGPEPVSLRVADAAEMAAQALLASPERDQPSVLRVLQRRLKKLS